MYNINNCDISISQNSFNVRLRNRLNIGVYIRQVFTFVDGRQVFTFVVGRQVFTFVDGRQVFTFVVGRQVFTFVDGRQVFTFVVGKIRTNAQMLNVGNISKSENKWFNNNVIK